MAAREESEIVRVVRGDDPTSEANSRRDGERIDGQLAAGAGICEEVTRNPSNAGARGYDLSEAPPE